MSWSSPSFPSTSIVGAISLNFFHHQRRPLPSISQSPLGNHSAPYQERLAGIKERCNLRFHRSSDSNECRARGDLYCCQAPLRNP
ncbi:unnamed protein product [Linum trigynum]|uniref:Uncharacterized protein n=1 Tax=Linum trigynum TaxID=586398 RepID=A0AAV2E785_9ROSI